MDFLRLSNSNLFDNMNITKFFVMIMISICIISCSGFQSSSNQFEDTIVEVIEDIDDLYDNDVDDGKPKVAIKIKSLDNEWFQTHMAPHRFILKSNKKFYEIEDVYDASLKKEGLYSINNGKITLSYANGEKIVGCVREDINNIYLDLGDYGWYVPVDPSNRTSLQNFQQNDYSWMDGDWSLSASINDPYVGTIYMHTSLKIDYDRKTMIMIDEDHHEVECNGRYTVNEDNTISCGRVLVRFDPNNKTFYEEYQGQRTYYYR